MQNDEGPHSQLIHFERGRCSTGCFTITVKSNFSSFMTFFDVLTFPMSVLCITGWDIYVFSHESSETIKNIWFQSVCSVGWLFWAKKPFFLFLILNGPKVVSDSFLPFGTISE